MFEQKVLQTIRLQDIPYSSEAPVVRTGMIAAGKEPHAKEDKEKHKGRQGRTQADRKNRNRDKRTQC